ncbi:RhuM family protein [Bifidobacterium sp. ESL0775]|uniref:virulence RhuM family protein n=1 Tax=Bifidobacterium sp. ESL0775 TaxID=2983230 RepID=UPI0023F64EA1|nr:RhuM family protein [Bifidobacterium sp. ESL0775]WEV69570.1 RhuM family protein [Bifidobacterium sp. ESL0775]
MDNDMMKQPQGEIVLYQQDDRNVPVQVVYRDETFWMAQKNIAELFGVKIPIISKHLANIYSEGELEEKATVSKMETVQNEGGRTVRREIAFYNLDAIIAVGYRVNSKRATVLLMGMVMCKKSGGGRNRTVHLRLAAGSTIELIPQFAHRRSSFLPKPTLSA